MASQAHAILPWGVDQRLMQLLAKTVAQAAFNGYYILSVDDPDGICFSPAIDGAGGNTCSRQESPTRVSISRGRHGLTKIAQALSFEALGACFGASVAWDDEFEFYRIDRPGQFKILPFRSLGDGLPLPEFAGLNELPGCLWTTTPAQAALAANLLDPVFFRVPHVEPLTSLLSGLPDPAERRRKSLQADVLYWAPRMDWAAAVEASYPNGDGLDARSAGSALMPSAALNIPLPERALSKAGKTGLERSLSVALSWGSARAAIGIHARLMQVSKDIAGSMARVKKRSDMFFARRANPCRDACHDVEAAEALFDALALAAEVADARPVQAPSLAGRKASL